MRSGWGCCPAAWGTGGLPPYHVGVRGGHDVGVGAVGAHGIPQSGEPRRGVGGRGGQVLVAQGGRQGFGGGGSPAWGSPGGAGTVHSTGDSPVGSQSSPECRSWGTRPAASVLGCRLGCRGRPEPQQGLQLLVSPRQRLMPLACLGEGTPGHSGMSTKGKVGWPRWAQQDGHKAQVRHWGAGRSQPRAEHPWGWDLSGSQGCALGLEQQNSPPRENPPMLHPHQASKTLRCTMLGLDGSPWIWSPPPPSPATGTSPTYPGEGAARLRSTGRAAWLLGSPRR